MEGTIEGTIDGSIVAMLGQAVSIIPSGAKAASWRNDLFLNNFLSY